MEARSVSPNLLRSAPPPSFFIHSPSFLLLSLPPMSFPNSEPFDCAAVDFSCIATPSCNYLERNAKKQRMRNDSESESPRARARWRWRGEKRALFDIQFERKMKEFCSFVGFQNLSHPRRVHTSHWKGKGHHKCCTYNTWEKDTWRESFKVSADRQAWRVLETRSFTTKWGNKMRG